MVRIRSTAVGGQVVRIVNGQLVASDIQRPQPIIQTPENAIQSTSENEDLKCVICLDYLQFAAETSCGHCFCASCLTHNFQRSVTCPVCRNPILFVHPSFAMRRIVETHLKKLNLWDDEGYTQRQREADNLLNAAFQVRREDAVQVAAENRRLGMPRTENQPVLLVRFIAVVLVALLATWFVGSQWKYLERVYTTDLVLRAVFPHRLQKICCKHPLVFLQQLYNGNSSSPISAESPIPPKQPFPPFTKPEPNQSTTPTIHLEKTLDEAAAVGDCLALARLLEKSQPLEKLNVALLEAAQQGHAEAVKMLLRYGADANTQQGSALSTAAKAGHVQVVSLLLAAGASTSKSILNQLTPLHHAAEGGHVEIVELLLNAGAPVDSAPSPQLLTPLYLASRAGHIHCVKLLVKRHATIDLPSAEKATPLYVAAEYGKLEVVKYLVGNGAKVETLMKSGATPLVIAAQNNRKDILQFLIQIGANPDAVGAAGMNARIRWCIVPPTILASLHLTSSSGHVECARLLLEAGSSPDATDNNGATPLQLAVLEWNSTVNAVAGGKNKKKANPESLLSIATLLLRYGANPSPSPTKNNKDIQPIIRTTPKLTNIFSGVQQIKCKIVPVNTKDAATSLQMNSVSSLREVLIRIEKMYNKEIEELATQNGKKFSTLYDKLETVFLSSLYISEDGELKFQVFFKKAENGKTKSKQKTNK